MLSRASYALEQLEQRILLSAEGLENVVLEDAGSHGGPLIALEESASTAPAAWDALPTYDPAAEIDQIFDITDSPTEDIVIDSGEVLQGSGTTSGAVLNNGSVQPGNSPGIQNVATFTQGPNAELEIEIGGTGGPGAANGHDQINVAGLATLDGTLRIQLINGFVPSVGNTFVIMTWGSRSGEFANWLGTVNIPGFNDRAFKPVYNAGNLTLEVVSTPTIIPAVGTTITSGLDTLASVGNLLEDVGEFAEDIPLIGEEVGNLVDIGTSITNTIRNQLSTLLSSVPRQSQVTSVIESWDGATIGGFTIDVKGVLGHYAVTGADPFWWDIDLVLTPTTVNRTLQDLTGALLGAVFNPDPTVAVQSSIELDFSFGYDSGFFVEIDKIVGSILVDVNGVGGFAFNLAPPGAPVTLNVTNYSIDLAASVTATPDESVLTGGRITSATLSGFSAGNISDAFNLTEAGTVDASFTVTGALTGFGATFSGTTTVHIESDDLFSGSEPDLTVEIAGNMQLLNQTLSGNFIIKKTASETIVEASNIVLDLKVGAGGTERRVIRAENGTGKFLLLGGELAGTASLTITQGPNIPNLTISGTTLNLAINTSSTAVPTIDGTAVNLPGGPYYRLSGNAVIALATPAVSLTGDFLFEPFDPTPATPGSGDEITTIAVANLSLSLEAGTGIGLALTNGSGVFVIKPNGIAGDATATATLQVPGVSLVGTIGLIINDTNAAYSATVDVNGTSRAINVPAGPYVRVTADDAELEVLGIEIEGDFAFEEKTTSTGGEKVTTIAVSNGSISLGSAANDLVNVSNVSGAFILNGSGIAGQATGTVTLGIPSVNLSGTFTVRVNDTAVAVNETVNVGGSSVTINTPAGPYFQVNGDNVTLTIFGIAITGDFSFEQRESENGTTLVTVRASDVDFDFGTNVLQLTNGEALFLILPSGIAGKGSIDVTVTAFGTSYSDTVDWAFNNTNQAIDEVVDRAAPPNGASPFSLLNQLTDFELPEGPFNRLSTHGPRTISVNVGGVTQSITAAMVFTLVDASPDYVTVGVSSLSTTLGASPLSLAVTGGQGAFVIKTNGIAGEVKVATATLGGAAGIGAITVQDFEFKFNNTGANVGPVTVSISDDAAEDVTINFTGAYYHNFLGFQGTASIVLTNLVTLEGTFTIQKSESSSSQLKIGVENLRLDIKAGSLNVLSLYNGTGGFIVSSAGIVGTASLQFQSGLIGLSGTIGMELNTTPSVSTASVNTATGTVSWTNLAANTLKITVNGSLLIGSVNIPMNFYVVINTSATSFQFFRSSDNALLLTIDSSGNITPTGILPTISDFAMPGPYEFVSMLRQLANWIGMFRETDLFDIEIPFTSGYTVGDAFDWSRLFLEQIYSHMVSVELQSRTISLTQITAGNLVDARVKLKIGTAVTEVVVAGAYTDLASLITVLNDDLVFYGLGTKVEARRNKDDLLVIALKPAEIAKGSTLSIVDLNTNFAALGFGPPDTTYGDSPDTSVEQVGVETARYSTEQFFAELGNRLGLTVVYQPERRIYTYTVDKSATYSKSLPFDLGFELGDIAEANLNGTLTVSATVGLKFTLGFDLSSGDVPHVLSSSTIPVPVHGRISSNAVFEVFINEDASPTTVTLPAAATSTNNSIEDLAKDLNDVFKVTPYKSSFLDQYIIARKAGSGLAISGINEDHDGDGLLGNVNEDTNGNRNLDSGEDLDGDGVLDRVEDLNGDSNLDNMLGVVNRIVLRSTPTSTFATELGFGHELLDLDTNEATTNDQYYISGAVAPIKGLFIENAELSGRFQVSTPGLINGSLRLGFVEISTSNGVVETLDQNGAVGPIRATINLVEAGSGDDRFYISDLFGGLSTDNIFDMITGPNFTGGFRASLNNISVGGLGFAFPLGASPTIGIFIPDITELEYNPEPYNGSNKGIFLTYPNLGQLTNFTSLSFTQIIRALDIIADNLSRMSAFSFLNEDIPFVNMSVNDMIDYAVKFADLIDAAANEGASSLQDTLTELKVQIDELFDLDPSILQISLDSNGVTTDPTFAGGVNNTTQSSAIYNPNGDNNAIQFLTSNLATAASFNGARIHVVGSSAVSGNNARVTWDSTRRQLKIEINPGVTTATAIRNAVNSTAGIPFTASLPNDPGANAGNNPITIVALKFQFTFTTAYADILPFQLDLADLVSQIAGDNVAARDFLEAARTLIQVEASGTLNVSASAALNLWFGLDVSNPNQVRPFFYDDTGITLTAKVLGTNLNVEASLGGIAGIWIKNGQVTVDADGDPATNAGNGDKGVKFRLGLKNNNGDNRHYFNEDWFNSNSLDLSVEGGVSATLPIFAPFESTPLDGDTDENDDGYADNVLAINIPDLVRLFINDKATGNTAILKFAGLNNDIHVVSTSLTNFEVDIRNDPSLTSGNKATATLSGSTLILTINSGQTTAQGAINVIKAVSGFTNTVKAPDDDGGAAGDSNTALGRLHVLTIVTPDFGALFDNLDLCAILDAQAGMILDGLDSFLGKIQDGLNDLVFSTEFPLIGDGLAGAANFIEEFRSGLLAELRSALDEAGGSATTAIENAIKKAFWNTLGPGGLDLLINPDGTDLDPALGFAQLDVTLDCEDGLIVNLRLNKTVALVDTSENPIDFSIGVPGFGLEVSGNVKVEIGFDLKFGFGFNSDDGFYFNSSAPASDPELSLFFKATIPGLSAKGELFFLQLDIMDDPEDPSSFEGHFEVNLKDPDGNGKLTFAEITSSGTQFDDVIEWELAAIADVNLDLAASFGGNTAFPRIIAEFHLDWEWDLEDGASTPEIAFTDIYLDLGTFISDFLGPILKEIRKVTEPLDPIIDIVTARLPVLSDLAGEDITLLDLAEIFGLLEPSTVDFIESVIQVINIINSLEGIGEGSILIPFGSFSLTADESGNMTNVNPLQNLGEIDLAGTIAGATGPGASSTYKNQTAEFAGDIGSLDNFSIPIFDNPSELFNIFVGKPVRLVEWRMPQFKFEFTYTQRIPIYPPLYAQFGGSIGATIDIGFGYDTYGIQKFIESEDKNALDLLDGFYVIDYDSNGNERPELSLTGEIFAGASINLLMVEAGVRGGITATIDFDLNDVVEDGKVRVSEIIANVQQDPRCIFDIHGELGLFLEAFLIIDLFFFSIDKTWRFAEITLFEFDITCPEPVLAIPSGTTLTLNVGKDAPKREEIDTNDGAETFIVKHLSGTAGSETVEVSWGNYKKEFSGVAKIVVVDAGEGNDYLDFRGVLAELEVHGGPGNDTIYLGNGNNSRVYGDAGNDIIVAGETGTGVIIYGGDDKDTITAGTVSIEIHGDSGADTITGSPQVDTLYGDGGNDSITGADGNDIIYGGDDNDTIDGQAGDDLVYGGNGADTLKGSRGNDIVYGDAGSDLVYGSAGNDFLIGGTGNDKVYGHGGIDLIVGDNVASATIGGIAITQANVGARLALIPTSGVSLQDLTGSGGDFLIGGGNVDVLFGGDGDDFMYGGNFINSGDTEVIEEDDNDFFDGGAGHDEIYGDDAQGKTGDRNTGITIKSSVFYDNNLNGIRDEGEMGVGNVEVRLYKTNNTHLATEYTEVDGSFEFKGIDPLVYYIIFVKPTGMAFTTKWAGGATSVEGAKDDSDADTTTGKTGQFTLTYDETEEHVAAGLTGPATVSISDQSVDETNTGETQVSFNVVLSGIQANPVEIAFETISLSATQGSGDYKYSKGTLVLNPGETSGTITVIVFGDSVYEDHEQFRLQITARRMDSTPVTLPVSDSDVRVTIINDDPIPQISIADYVPASDATEGTPAFFIISLSNPSQQTITVEYRVDMAYTFFALEAENAARPFPLYPLAEADFVMPAPGTITFQPGETQKKIQVTLVNDSLDEHEEHFFVDLFSPVRAKIADGRGYGIIPDDDAEVSVMIVPVTPVPGKPYFTTVTEGSSAPVPVNFEIKLSKVSGKEIHVTFATQYGTALESYPSGNSENGDYVGLPNKLSTEAIKELVFAPGETSKIITVEVLPDNLVEGTEEFYVNILSARDAEIAANPLTQSNHVTVLIGDDDTIPDSDAGPWSIRFGQIDYVVDEPASGTTQVEITLFRTPGSSHPIAVFFTAGGTATAGADYNTVFRQLVYFAGNETTKKVYVTIKSDSVAEGDETIDLRLLNPTGGPVNAAPDQAKITIRDEDAPRMYITGPAIFIFPGVNEGSSGAFTNREFKVKIVGGAGAQGATVFYETVSLTARAGTDFNSVSNTLTFLPGETEKSIFVPVNEDTIAELTETFAVRLKNATNVSLVRDDSVVITPIYDDDLSAITGMVFYDNNGNGFKDVGENGIAGVDVTIKWYLAGTQQTSTVQTNASGIYTTNVALGQVHIAVDGATVTSPYQPFFLGSGEYELTTDNDTQTVTFDGVVGISPFTPVGYKTTFTFSLPSKSKDVGRGGTDDTIFGGPGNDLIDAGAGDDFVVGGHWMTATDANMPVNNGNYDAIVTATSSGLHVVHDSGPIFSVSTAGLGLDGSISGQIWRDLNNNNTQDLTDPLFTGEVIVNLFDCDGNPVNTVVTTNGTYSFTNLFVDPEGGISEYTVEFLLPVGFDFVSPNIGGSGVNSDAVNGGRTVKLEIKTGTASHTQIDAGLKPSNLEPASGSGSFEFDNPSFSVAEDIASGVVQITIVRGSSYDPRAVVLRTFDGAGASGAKAGINYVDVSILVYFEVGETVKVVEVPIIDSDSIPFCENRVFHLELRDITGRPYANAVVYIFAEGAGSIPDDDTIFGGNDWDIIIGDSGYIPASVVIATSATLNNIVYYGGPGHDVIHGGNGPDYINGQLGNDTLAGNEGTDQVRGGLGNDIIVAELDNDLIDGDHGRDTMVSDQDVARIELTSTGATTATLVHRGSDGLQISTFSLRNMEVAKLFGGYKNNVFDIQSWNGSAHIFGGSGSDTLLVRNDTDMKLKDATLLESLLYFALFGYSKDSAITLLSGATYHLGSLEKVVLTGGASANTLDASAYSRSATFIGLGGDDILIGGSAADTFEFDADSALGKDTVKGNGGADTLDFSSTTTVTIAINLAQLNPVVQTVNPNLQLVLQDLLENVIGGSLADNLTGNDLDNVLQGGPGDDTLSGGAGSERYVFDTDTQWGTETIFEFDTDTGHDVLDFSGTSNLVINLNMGILGAPQVVNANLTLELHGEGIEEVIGGSQPDVIRGNSNNNTLRGGPGNDLLDGKSGDDVLDGGAGNDDLNGGPGTDTINESRDTSFTLSDRHLIRGTGETDTLDNIEVANLKGGSSANTFDLTGWTGSGSINGNDSALLPPAIDTLIMAADASYVLTNGSLVVTFPTHTSTITLNDINFAILSGGAGNDTIDASGFSGSTTLSGGDGNDIIKGGSGADTLSGGEGDDTISGNAGADNIDAGAGTDTLLEIRDVLVFVLSNANLTADVTALPGDEEADTLAGFESASLTGGSGGNNFDVSGWTAGNLIINGQTGTDRVMVTVAGQVQLTATQVIIAGATSTITIGSIEAATLQGSAGDDLLDASNFPGQVTLLGGDGNDTLVSGAGNDILSGGAGDDLMVFKQQSSLDTDRVIGGDGEDTLDFSAFTSGVTVNLSTIGINQTVLAGELVIRLNSVDVENVIGGSGADALTGSAFNNTFTAGAGADVINGGGGSDIVVESADANFTLTNTALTIGATTDMLVSIERAILTGGTTGNSMDASAFTGSTTLKGEAGNDILIGGSGSDLLIGGAGDDTLRGGAGSDIYQFDVDNVLGSDTIDELAASSGTDFIDFRETTTVGLNVSLALTSIQTVHATNFSLTLTSGGSIEYLYGGSQNDVLRGNTLNNTIAGGAGDDTIDGLGGTDTFYESRDADFVLTNTSLKLTLQTSSGPVVETDTLVNFETAFLQGGESSNTIDAFGFSNGGLTIWGEGGNDTIIGTKLNDTLRGGDGNDVLYGNPGNDVLRGDDGDDTLVGGYDLDAAPGGDDDQLFGGVGNDTYVFDKTLSLGADQVTELTDEGSADTLQGVGIAGIDVNLYSTAQQTITSLFKLTLLNSGQVEFSF